MRLVSLEIKGFKSFAEKTVINFNDSVTGVVGPNGCGKSNVVDAIRWVLGEQKTSMLRSEKMENIIFNGTKNRKASSLAEVSLTFENNKNLLPTEFHTVTISRHYYRNGDSEYKLNGITCRLKDITSLFLDTGISSDSYAIMELSMVDEILNDKEHSRRKLFEQAAGISKYKTRKKETLNKLEATQGDLNRVDDLLFEIETNLKALESQARKTERYYKLKEEYTQLSIELALFTLSDFRKSFAVLQLQQQQEEDKKLKLETELVMLEAAMLQEKADNIEKEKQMVAVQRELNDFVTSIKQRENDKNILLENLKFQKDKKETLTSQNIKAGADLEQISESIHEFHEQKIRQNILFNSVAQEVEVAKQVLRDNRGDHSGIKIRLEQQTVLMRGLEKEFSEIEKTIAIHTVQKNNLLQEKGRSETEYEGRNDEHKLLTQQLKAALSEEQLKKLAVLELTQSGDALQEQLNGIEEELETHREQLRSVHRHLDAKQNEYNLTKSFIDNMEGFPESIKFLKQHPEWTTHAPLLSDIISCPAEYRVSIENYLDSYLNFYIVSDMADAMNAVNLLSSAAKGRANFFVLSDFENILLQNQTAPSNAVRAMDVVEVDSKFHKLVSYLLSETFILLDDHIDLSNFDKRSSLISKNGKFVRTPLSLSGGQVGSFSGKRLGRIKNLKVVEKEIQKLRDQSEHLHKIILALQNDMLGLRSSSKDTELDDAREAHNEIKNKLTSLQAKIESIEIFFQNHKAHLEDINRQLEDLETQHKHLIEKLNIQTDKKQGIQELLDHLLATFAESEQKLNESSQLFNEKNIQFVQHQNTVTAIDRELEYREHQQSNILQLIQTNQSELDHADDLISTLEEKRMLAEQVIIQDYSHKEIIEKRVSDVEQVYYESRGKIHDADERLRTISKNKEQVEILLNQIRERTTEIKIQLNSLKDRLDIEFKIDIEELMDREPSIEANPEELQTKSEKLKNRIETYGEINPMAMEAYNEMKERHDFIVTQKADLMSAKSSLLQTIEEIETTAKEQFLTAFNTIKENFVKVFKSLFTNDDECDLVLEDPDNMLESRIQIMARPKGKRPQVIDQLSGGEKTLTAISLLFALYLYKPAPFCILDEVDAPLDDANIEKFNKIVRDFSLDSQFVLVTHNKNTMASVDIIYGITMQEEGISKVVPVDFRSLN